MGSFGNGALGSLERVCYQPCGLSRWGQPGQPTEERRDQSWSCPLHDGNREALTACGCLPSTHKAGGTQGCWPHIPQVDKMRHLPSPQVPHCLALACPGRSGAVLDLGRGPGAGKATAHCPSSQGPAAVLEDLLGFSKLKKHIPQRGLGFRSLRTHLILCGGSGHKLCAILCTPVLLLNCPAQGPLARHLTPVGPRLLIWNMGKGQCLPYRVLTAISELAPARCGRALVYSRCS